MIIDTTINIKNTLIADLDRCSRLYTISRSEVICLLLYRFIKDNKPRCSLFRRVKYQERDSSGCWDTIHVFFTEDMYEFSSDIRKFFKLSVSLAVSLAITLYLDIIEKELGERQKTKKITDNYLKKYFFFCCENINSYDFHIFWDMENEKKAEKKTTG